MAALVAVAASAALVAGCGHGTSDSGSTAAKSKTILIGDSNIESGPAAVYKSAGDGVKRYLDYVNAHGGVNGYTFKVVMLDNHGTPDGGAQSVRQLVNQGVFAMSLLGSDSLAGAIPVLRSSGQGTTVFAFAGTSLIDSSGLTNIYGQAPNNAENALFDVKYLVTKRHIKNLGVVYENDALGAGVKENAPKLATQFGATKVTTVPVTLDTKDFGPIVSKLKSAGATGVEIVATSPIVASIQKAAVAIGYHPTWMSYYGTLNQQYLDLAGKAAEGTLTDAFLAPLDAHDGAVKLFNSYMKQHEPKAANTYGQDGWVIGELIEAAVKGATTNGGRLTQDRFRQALNDLHGKSVGMVPYVGYTAEDHSTLASELSVYQVRNGQFKQVTGPQKMPKLPD